MKRRSGLALLLAVGVLGILAVLALAFVTLARLERRASLQRLYGTKALLLARSGLEDALARLTNGQDQDLPPNRYEGEDWNADGTLSAFEAPEEVYQPGTLNTDDCPTRQALRPSFAYRAGAPDPKLVQVDARRRGFSGRLSGDLAGDGGHYALNLRGEDGIYVNGGELSAGGVVPLTYSSELKGLLGSLAEEIDLADGIDDGIPTDRFYGELLVAARPAGGWRDKEHILQTAGALKPKFEPLMPYLTTRAWVDRKVVRPNVDPDWVVTAPPPTPNAVTMQYPAGTQTASALAEITVGKREVPYFYFPTVPVPQGIGMLWSSKRSLNPFTGSYAPRFELGSGLAVLGRAPVNVNWAKDRPLVLKALLRDLKGVYLDSGFMSALVGPGPGGPLPYCEQDDGTIGILCEASLSASSDLPAVVAAFQAHAGFPTWQTEFPDWDRTPSFDSWDEFNRFVDLKLTMIARAQRDLLKAMANPNTGSNKFNPGESMARLLDKTDLQRYTTEFCFRTPHLVATATGRVLDGKGRVLAERTLSCSLAFEQARLTTQSEFCAGNLGRLEVAGDESAFRLPGAAGFLQPSGSVETTYGSRMLPGGRGLALQSYPEPQWPAAAGPCPSPAAYDGNLQLATLETGIGSELGMTFLASWDTGFGATYALGSPVCTTDQGHASPATSLFGSGAAAPVAALNMIHPDGVYSEGKRTPGYTATTNLGDGLQGIASLWYKPAFSEQDGVVPAWVARNPTLLNLLSIKTAGSVGGGTSEGSTQFFALGACRLDTLSNLPPQQGFVWGLVAENRNKNNDWQVEGGPLFGWTASDPARKRFWHAHRWHLVTAQWNLPALSAATQGHLTLNDADHLSTGMPYYFSGYSAQPGTLTLTTDGFGTKNSFGPPLAYLGSNPCNPIWMHPADGTLDELMFLTQSTDMLDGQLLAADRYPAGRYSKEDAAFDPSKPEWLSAGIGLPPGSRLLRADWTLVMPRDPPPSASIPDFFPPPHQVFYGTGTDPLSGETADAAIELTDLAGAKLLPGPLTLSGTALRLQPPSGNLKIGLSIRPRMGDNDPAWDKLSTPLLESPALDDITVTYTPAEGPRITAFREGEAP